MLRLSGYTEEEAERTWQRLRDRGQLIGEPTTIVEADGPLTATVNWEIDVDIWPRFATKVALAFVSLFVDDDWLVTEDARVLREVLWNGHTKLDALAHPGVAWSSRPLHLRAGSHPLRIGEHVLVFEETEADGSWFSMVLFGDLLYRVPARVPWPHGFAPSCWFGPDNKTGRQLPSVVQWHLLTSRFRRPCLSEGEAWRSISTGVEFGNARIESLIAMIQLFLPKWNIWSIVVWWLLASRSNLALIWPV